MTESLKAIARTLRKARSEALRPLRSINDRGPFLGEPVIDLSTAAAEAIGLSRVGKITLAKL